MAAKNQNKARTVSREMRELAQRIGVLVIAGNKADFELGELVDQVFRDHLWRNWPTRDFASEDEWCWTVLGFHRRKAQYLRSNYTALAAMDLGEDTKARALRLGWTKLPTVLRAAKSEKALLEWLDRIDDENLSEAELRAEVDQALMPLPDSTKQRDRAHITPGSAADEAQPRDRDLGADGGRESGERFHNGANERTDDRPKQYVTVVFDDAAARKVYTKAVDAIRKRNGEMGDGRAIAMMATSYLAGLPREDEGGVAVELEFLLRSIEATYGVRLAVCPDVDETPVPVARKAAADADVTDFG